MNKEFVSYEEALALKELGFNEPCIAFVNLSMYNLPSQKDRIKLDFSVLGDFQYYNDHKHLLAYPLLQQAFRWLRNKHNLTHKIFRDGGWYLMSIVDISNEDNEAPEYNSIGAKDKYEDAELDCLIKLIEIAKQK